MTILSETIDRHGFRGVLEALSAEARNQAKLAGNDQLKEMYYQLAFNLDSCLPLVPVVRFKSIADGI